MDDTLHYLIMANQMLVQKALLEQLKDTGLTIGQPKILDYLKDHDGSNQKEIARACFLEAGSLTIILNKTPFSELCVWMKSVYNSIFWMYKSTS